jgi:hypothetical protein
VPSGWPHRASQELAQCVRHARRAEVGLALEWAPNVPRRRRVSVHFNESQDERIRLVEAYIKNAILIVEVARELRQHGKEIVEAAIDAARSRFRPILMTSFAFILGVVPLVLATGAGASARKSIGITVFSGMIASTCLAVLFVPALFVLLQQFEEWLKARRRTGQKPQPQSTG